MKPTHWLLLGSLVTCATAPLACSSDFRSCFDTRTCAAGGKGGAGAAGEEEAGGAAAGSKSDAGAAGEVTTGEGGAAGAAFDACEGVEFDIDPKNCGACGHDCLGGECTMATCQPITIEPGPTGSFTRSMSIAVDSEYVYWGGDNARVARKKLNGSGQVEVFVPGGTDEFAYDMVVTSAGLFWSNDWTQQGLRKCSLDGCKGGPTTAAATGLDLRALIHEQATDSLYWTQPDSIWTQSLPRGLPIKATAAVEASPYLLTVDEKFFYWAEYNSTSKRASIYKRQRGLSNASPIPLAVGRLSVEAIAVFGSTLFEVESSAESGSTLRGIPLPNGVADAEPPLLVPSSGGVYEMTSDSSGVYWTSRGGVHSVKACRSAKCAGGPSVLALTQEPWGITTDRDAVYWVTESGAVMKVAK